MKIKILKTHQTAGRWVHAGTIVIVDEARAKELKRNGLAADAESTDSAEAVEAQTAPAAEAQAKKAPESSNKAAPAPKNKAAPAPAPEAPAA